MTHSKDKLLSCITVLIISTMMTVSAMAHIINVVPPPSDGVKVNGNPTMNTPPSREAFLGPIRIKLEETTLNEVLKKTKTGHIYQMGDAGDDIYWLCYYLLNNSAFREIWISSSGEMGGPDHAVTEIQVIDIGSSPVSPATQGCPLLPSSYNDLILDHGIRIGMSSGDLMHKLGQPTADKSNWLVYGYEGIYGKNIPIKNDQQIKDDDYVESNWLEVKIIDGLISEFSITKITSN